MALLVLQVGQSVPGLEPLPVLQESVPVLRQTVWAVVWLLERGQPLTFLAVGRVLIWLAMPPWPAQPARPPVPPPRQPVLLTRWERGQRLRQPPQRPCRRLAPPLPTLRLAWVRPLAR